jgi:hypothetical protein
MTRSDGRSLALAFLGIVVALAPVATRAADLPQGKMRPALATQATVIAQSNARLAGEISKDGFILRGKGIASVTHPTTGTYCIRPSLTTLDIHRIVPVLTFDFDSSNDFDVFVTWSPVGFFCGGAIEVDTYQSDAGAGHVTADEGFTILVQ